MAKKLLGFFNKQKQFEQDVMENGMQYSSFYGDSLRRLKKNKMAMFCACVLILLALMAIFAPLLAPYDPTYQDYSAVLGGPCKAHPFGTDEFGRDILSRIIYGSRVSMIVAVGATIVGAIIGSLLIGTINNGLMFFGLSTAQQTVAKGAIIILSVALSALVSLRDNNNK